MRSSRNWTLPSSSVPRYLVLSGLAVAVCVAMVACTPTASEPQGTTTTQPDQAATLDTEDCGLSTGPMGAARLADLPDDLVLRSAEVSISRAELDAEINRSVAADGGNQKLRDWPFFLLENMAIEALLKQEAQQWAEANDREGGALLDDYLQSIADSVAIDEEQVRAYYEANTQLFGDRTYEQEQRDQHHVFGARPAHRRLRLPRRSHSRFSGCHVLAEIFKTNANSKAVTDIQMTMAVSINA